MPITSASAAAEAPAPTPAFDRESWKSDFERMKLGLAQGYANLDWQVERRGINLQRASKQIAAMVDRAGSDVEMVVILSKLVAAFDDPHLQLQIGEPPESATLLPLTSSIEGPASGSDQCPNAGYSAAAPETGLPYVKSAQWKQTSAGPFLAGTVGDVGFVRIPSFSEERYLDACNKVAKPGMDRRALQLATRAELNRELKSQIEGLRKAGARRLAVDVSGNGGGSEWSSEVAAMLASGTLKRPTPLRASPSCDRSAIWEGKRVCSIYGQASALFEEMEGEGTWDGPLAVLTDSRSGSATEEFVTWLKDNKKAVIAGQRTFGAGCGYIDGGYAIPFKSANIHIMVPNCSRYTSEGINEIEGIAPDVPIDWAGVKPDEVTALLNRVFQPL